MQSGEGVIEIVYLRTMGRSSTSCHFGAHVVIE